MENKKLKVTTKHVYCGVRCSNYFGRGIDDCLECPYKDEVTEEVQKMTINEYVKHLCNGNIHVTKVEIDNDKPNKFFVCDFYNAQSYGPFSSSEETETYIRDNNLKYAKIYELLKDYEPNDVTPYPIGGVPMTSVSLIPPFLKA